MKTKFVLSLLLITLCVVLANCGQDTIGDMAQREQNRQRVRNSLFDNQNKVITGVYQGQVYKRSTKANAKDDDFVPANTSDVFLIVRAAKVSAGDVTLTPSLSGTLIIAPRLDTSNEPYQQSYPFSKGQFDPLDGDSSSLAGKLAFSVEGSTNPTDFTCDADGQHNLSCTWYIFADTRLRFKPVPEKTLSFLSQVKRSNVTYLGQNEQFSILMQFESGPGPQTNSKVPDPTILGRMMFTSKSGDAHVPASFKSGVFDPVNGEISLTLDDDAQGTVDCLIKKSGASLDCKWHTKAFQTFTVTRTAKTKN